jgi:CHAT domain-containing protein
VTVSGIPDYDELKLRIEPLEEGSYRALAFGPDGSTAQGAFDIPFSDTELDMFVLQVGQSRRSMRAYRSSKMEDAKRLGSKLFESLFQGDVREVYNAARSMADWNQRGLRVTLSLTGAPHLMDIPWEFLYERPNFLSQSIYTPLVRSLDLKRTRPPRRVKLPLQVLGMVSRPDGFDNLDIDQERSKLENALRVPAAKGLLQLRWLDRATLSELERTVGAPDEIHVLHYIGHGDYDDRGQVGVLILEDERGRPHEVTGEDLGSVLLDERSLQLVVLNSCEGARSSHVDPFSGAATSLIEFGLPAVVGMQFEITDGAAITFADRFYTALGQGFPVDAAVAQARKALFAQYDIEFCTPVLFLRAADARLFDIEPVQTTPTHQEVLPSEPEAEQQQPPPDQSGPVAEQGRPSSDQDGPVASRANETQELTAAHAQKREDLSSRVRFLTDEWARLITEAINSDAAAARAMAGVRLSWQTRVTGSPQGDCAYFVRIEDGKATVSMGEVDDADFIVISSYEEEVRELTSKSVMRSLLTGGGELKKGSTWKALRNLPLLARLQKIWLEVGHQVEV